MLRDMIIQTGKSVYSIAAECALPYTTVNELVLSKKDINSCSVKTISALAAYFKMPIEVFCRAATEPDASVQINPTWQKATNKRYRFPVVEEEKRYDASLIHPLKQRMAKSVYEAVLADQRVKSLTIFGSAVNIRCNRNSDIDLAVTLFPDNIDSVTKNEVSEKIQEACGYGADILWMDRILPGSGIAKNIEKGVKLI